MHISYSKLTQNQQINVIMHNYYALLCHVFIQLGAAKQMTVFPTDY